MQSDLGVKSDDDVDYFEDEGGRQINLKFQMWMMNYFKFLWRKIMDYRQDNNEGDCNFIMNGKFTFSDHERFRDIVNIIKTEKIKSLCFDLEEVDFIDSAALGMLLIAHEEAETLSIPVVLKNTKHVDKIMKISKFDTLFTMKQEP